MTAVALAPNGRSRAEGGAIRNTSGFSAGSSSAPKPAGQLEPPLRTGSDKQEEGEAIRQQPAHVQDTFAVCQRESFVKGSNEEMVEAWRNAYNDASDQEYAWKKKRFEARERICELIGMPLRSATIWKATKPEGLLAALDLTGKKHLSPSQRKRKRALGD